MIRLYLGPLSLFSRKVEIALLEKGQAFERILVPFSQARGYEPRHPAVLAANPKRQVPVLVDGDLTLFDSTVIFEYLEEAYPRPALYPVGVHARAHCRLLELTADEILFAPVRNLLYRTEPPHPDAARQAERDRAGLEAESALRDQLAELDKRLAGGDFFCGDLSVADIALFMTVLFAQRLGGPALEKFPRLAAWYARLLQRPAFGAVAADIAAADRELSAALHR
ncbi:glutathione S-transferase family protein [Dongia soli]|uniref:Glutathione S-transferase family protein n=1 Tax=Dongia soli TaxID=600628 RepID=A0ABU5E6B6_9PROT|nr:glutathione S-transferase family protein [Dongia soli]MDY0881711.1 glutathione S-transferase family protein [Dongia soli]